MTPEPVHLRPAESLLANRARDLLRGGPCDSATLVARVCQMPSAPGYIADHMAMAMLSAYPEFTQKKDGMWYLAGVETSAQHTYAASAPVRAVFESAPHVLTDLSYVVVDTETTGTSPWRGHRITEFAAVLVRGGEIVDVYETLVNPERPIPPMITSITNITWEMVRHAPRFVDVCDAVLRSMDGHVFTAHNAAFDWRFVSAEVRRATGRPLGGRTLCTVRLARKVHPQLRRRSLDVLQHYYGIENTARHRAGGDAIATAKVLVKLLAAAADRGVTTWPELEAFCARGTGKAKRVRRGLSGLPKPAKNDDSA